MRIGLFDPCDTSNADCVYFLFPAKILCDAAIKMYIALGPAVLQASIFDDQFNRVIAQILRIEYSPTRSCPSCKSS